MVRIVAIGLVGMLLTLLIRPYRSDLATLCAMATGAIVLLSVLGQATELLASLARISQEYHVDATLFTTMLKITGIAYIAEFGIQACKDAGEGAIASKIELGAKILLLAMCLPIVQQILSLLASLLP